MNAAVYPSATAPQVLPKITPRSERTLTTGNGGFHSELKGAMGEDTRAARVDHPNPEPARAHEPVKTSFRRPGARDRSKQESRQKDDHRDSNAAPVNLTAASPVLVLLPETGSGADSPVAGGPAETVPETAATASSPVRNTPAGSADKTLSAPNLAFAVRISLKEDTAQTSDSPADASGPDSGGPERVAIQPGPEAPAIEQGAQEIRIGIGSDREAGTTAIKSRYEQPLAGPPPADAEQAENAPATEGSQDAIGATGATGAAKTAALRDMPAQTPVREPSTGQVSNPAAAFPAASQARPAAVDTHPKSAAPIDPKSMLREPQSPQPASVRDLSLRLSNSEHDRIDIRLVERGGEIRVAVRTSDTELARGLRTDLSDLAGRLDHNGFHAEIWRPAESGFSQADQGNNQSGNRDGAAGSRNPDARQSGSSQGQDPRQEEQQQPRWVDEIALRLAHETTSQR